MRARSGRFIVFGIITLASLASCGNFTLSSILDTPPEIPPGAKALTIAPSTVNAEVKPGSTVQFTASGGSGSYTWTEDTDSGLVNGTGRYTVPAIAGTYTVSVRDNGTGETQEATVFATATIPLSISPTMVNVNTGSVTTFTASGGSPFYSWSTSGSGLLSPLTGPATTYHAPPGGETITVTVTDNGGTGISVHADVIVTDPPVLTISPKKTAILVGGSVTFSAGGGTGTYTYSLVDGSGQLIGDTYTAPDFDEVAHINVTDTSPVDPDTATVTVYFPLTIIPTAVTVAPGSTYQFIASGGVPFEVGQPYHYAVTQGNGTIPVGSDVFTAPGVAEPDNIVTVVDSLGNSSPAMVTIVAPPLGWSMVSIDAGARSGQYASLALDPVDVNHSPRIAYYESQAKKLRFASWDGTTWTVQVVDTAKSVGQYCSLALEPGTGYPRISYYDAQDGELQYAAWNGSSWTLQTVDTAGDVGQYTSIALEPGTNYPRISYYDAGQKDLKYAAWNGSAWVKETVDSVGDVGKHASLALDSSGKPRIAYYDATGKNLKYVAYNTGWDIPEAVDSAGDVGQYASLVLNSSDNPRIAYYDAGAVKQLKYVEKNGSWGTREIVDSVDVGQYASLALNSAGKPRIAYYDATGKNLKYVENNGAWGVPETVDSPGDVGRHASLKLDPSSGKPRIAYYNATAQDLKFAEKP